MIDREKVFQYFKEQEAQTDQSAWAIAGTMIHLRREFHWLAEEEVFQLACKCFETARTSDEPWQYEEVNEALCHMLEFGIAGYGGYIVDRESIPAFLLACDQELFDYILTNEAAENRMRYTVGYPDDMMTEKQLAAEMEKTFEKLEKKGAGESMGICL